MSAREPRGSRASLSTASSESLRALLESQQQQLEKQQSQLEDLRLRLDHLAVSNESQRSESEEMRRRLSESVSMSDLRRFQSSLANVQDRLYEMDKSWRNNLLFYGVPTDDDEDVDNAVTEDKIRRLLSHKLRISRDVAISRVTRLWHGPDVRGQKPVQVCLVHYRDKESILRQARLLRGSNVFVSEDFSRRVREHRHELIRFMKELRARDPSRRMTLRYDKLYVGHKDIFFYNDLNNRVERMHNSNGHFNSSFRNGQANDIINQQGSQQLIDDLLVQDVQSELRDSRGGPSWLHRSRAPSRSFNSPSKFVRKKNLADSNNNNNFSYPASPAAHRSRPTASARPGGRASSSKWPRLTPVRSADTVSNETISPRRRAIVFKDLDPNQEYSEDTDDEFLELTTTTQEIVDNVDPGNIGNTRFEVIDRSVATLPPIRSKMANVTGDVGKKKRLDHLPAILQARNGEITLALDHNNNTNNNNEENDDENDENEGKKLLRLALVGQFELAKNNKQSRSIEHLPKGKE